VSGSILATGAQVGEGDVVEREVVWSVRKGDVKRMALAKTGKKS